MKGTIPICDLTKEERDTIDYVEVAKEHVRIINERRSKEERKRFFDLEDHLIHNPISDENFKIASPTRTRKCRLKNSSELVKKLPVQNEVFSFGGPEDDHHLVCNPGQF